MIPRGRRQVTCNSCGAEGVVVVGRTLKSGHVHVEDHVPHEETCPLFKREQPRHLKKKEWRRQEKRANELVGARETLASGAVGEDGDGRRIHEWRVESKQTGKDTYLLRQDTWTKLVRGALRNGEEPLLHVQFFGRHRWESRLVVLRKELYDSLSAEEPNLAPWAKNAKSFRLEKGSDTPLLVDLDPPGVMIEEADFQRLKEKL